MATYHFHYLKSLIPSLPKIVAPVISLEELGMLGEVAYLDEWWLVYIRGIYSEAYLSLATLVYRDLTWKWKSESIIPY